MAMSETLVVLGGTLASNLISNAVFGFNSGLKTWHCFPSMLKARACHRAVFAQEEGVVIVVGGSDTWPSSGYDECEMLSVKGGVKSQGWKTLPSLIHPRSCHGLAYFGGRVYACAGMMDPDAAMRRGPSTWTHEIDQFDLTDSCEVLDVQAAISDSEASHSTWKTFSPLNLRRFGLQLLTVQLQERVFLLAIGGRGPHPAAEYSVEAIELVDGLPRTVGAEASAARWSLLPVRLGAPRIDFAATVVRDVASGKADVVILGGNRVTHDEKSDSSRTWEVLRLGLSTGGELVAESFPGNTRLPASRVGCRADLLRGLVAGKQYLTVAGGFKAWGEGQNTYKGPVSQSVAVFEIHGGEDERVGTWVGTAGGESPQGVGLDELQMLPEKLRQPATCVALVGTSDNHEL